MLTWEWRIEIVQRDRTDSCLHRNDGTMAESFNIVIPAQAGIQRL
jgi:hypothetical protein